MKLAILGASGFSRETADVALDMGYKDIVFVDYLCKDESYFGFSLYEEAKIPELVNKGYSFIIGVGDNRTRKKIFSKFSGLPYVNVIHSSATFGHHQRLYLEQTVGNIITAGVRFTNNIVIGDFGIYNLNCTIGHDCVVEDFINLAPGANISGNVFLSEGAYVGTNACVLQGKSIDDKLILGKYAVVGAGSVVTKHVQNDTTVKGVPAR